MEISHRLFCLLYKTNYLRNDSLYIRSARTARSEALKNNTQVTICKSSDNTTCDPDLEWQAGWIMFVDDNADGNRGTGGGGEEILLIRAKLEANTTLSSAAFDDYIAYAPSGLSIGSSSNAGSFRLCDLRGLENARDINVVRTGSSSVSQAAGGEC